MIATIMLLKFFLHSSCCKCCVENTDIRSVLLVCTRGEKARQDNKNSVMVDWIETTLVLAIIKGNIWSRSMQNWTFVYD